MGNVAVLYWNMDPKDMENIIRLCITISNIKMLDMVIHGTQI